MTTSTPILLRKLAVNVLVSVSVCWSAQAIAQISGQYETWLTAVGLSDVFKLDQEVNTGQRLVLTLDAGHIEHAATFRFLSEEKQRTEIPLRPLYQKLFAKLASFSRLPPHAVTLQIKVWRGYCGSAGVKLTVNLRDGRFTIDEEVFSPAPMILCSLNFHWIETSERKTRTAIEEAQILLPLSHVASSPATVDDLESYFRERYGKAGAEVIVTGRSGNHLALVLRGLRGVVIREQKYWEKIQVFFLIVDLEGQRQTDLIVDGQFASGLLTPPDSAYLDMEPRFTGELREYGRALFVGIRKEIGDD